MHDVVIGQLGEKTELEIRGALLLHHQCSDNAVTASKSGVPELLRAEESGDEALKKKKKAYCN